MNQLYEQGARLEEIIRSLGMTQKAFAQIVSISPSFITNMVTGKKGVSARVINGVTKNYPQVNVPWLLTGEGEMLLEKKPTHKTADEPERASVVEEPGAVYGGGVVERLAARVEALERRVEVLEGEKSKST